MTLDEAIKHAEEVMIENLEKTKDRNASDPIAINCFECAEEHRQLAEWLKDYKRLLEQEPNTGHWIEKDGFDGDVYYDCSECGESFCLIDGTPTDNLYNYCPNCGAKMVEQRKSEDKE